MVTSDPNKLVTFEIPGIHIFFVTFLFSADCNLALKVRDFSWLEWGPELLSRTLMQKMISIVGIFLFPVWLL